MKMGQIILADKTKKPYPKGTDFVFDLIYLAGIQYQADLNNFLA